MRARRETTLEAPHRRSRVQPPCAAWHSHREFENATLRGRIDLYGDTITRRDKSLRIGHPFKIFQGRLEQNHTCPICRGRTSPTTHAYEKPKFDFPVAGPPLDLPPDRGVCYFSDLGIM